MIELRGSDILDVIALAETKGVTPNGTLTVLSSALSLVAMNEGVGRKALLRAVEAAYDQTRKIAPNTARKSDAVNN